MNAAIVYKQTIFFLVCLLFSSTCFAQYVNVTSYYDVHKKSKKEDYYVLKKNTDVKDSIYTSYYLNGYMKSTGYYIKNKAEGLWLFYYENGSLKMEGNMKSGEKNGIWKYYYENGNISMEGQSIAGKKSGFWKFYYENGKLRSEGVYETDKKQGPWNYYFEDEGLKAMANYEYDSGDYMELYPSGKLKAAGRVEQGKSVGVWTYYHEDGSILASGEETAGLKNGYWKFYYPNGQLASEGNYINGKTTGDWKYYYDNGTLSAEGNMNSGTKEGAWKIYYKSGQFKGETNYVNGEGIYREYYESGRVRTEGKIINEKHEGVWNYYLESGELEGTCNYLRGKGLYKGFYENGSLKMEGDLENGSKVGVWKLYNEDGSLAGYYKTFYENQAPVFQSDSTPKFIAKKDTLAPSEKPKYVTPKKKSRYFTPRVNEFKGFIVSSNPLYLINSSFPLSVEYYLQERLGYEGGILLFNKPMFKSHEHVPDNSLFYQAWEVYLQQKFYQKDKDFGMLYFAHEMRYSNFQYGNHYVDFSSSSHSTTPVNLQQSQQRIEYSVLLGDRIVTDQRKKGWSLDAYIGLGIGYRIVNNNWQGSNSKFDGAFSGISTSPLSVPFRFGFTLGYKFPR